MRKIGASLLLLLLLLIMTTAMSQPKCHRISG